MAGWIVLGAVLALLALVLLLPLGVRVTWDGTSLTLRWRAGPLERALPDRKEAPPQEEAPKKQTEDKPPEKKRSLSLNREQILYTIETLPPVLLRAARRVGRGIRLAPLTVHILVAGRDPADTALLYGRLQAALGGFLPVLHRLVKVREQDVRLFPDFQGEEMDLRADVGISLRLGTLLAAALGAGAAALGWLRGLRRLSAGTEGAAPPEKDGGETPPAPPSEKTTDAV